jgi:hypothetical protein
MIGIHPRSKFFAILQALITLWNDPNIAQQLRCVSSIMSMKLSRNIHAGRHKF